MVAHVPGSLSSCLVPRSLLWCLTHLPPPSPSTLFCLVTNPLSLHPSDTPQLTLDPILTSFSQILLDSQQVTGAVTWGYLEIISKLKKIKGKRCFVSLRKHTQESFIVFLHPAFSCTKTGLKAGFSGLYKRQPACTASSKDPGLAPLLQWRGAPKGTHLLPTLGPGIGGHQQPIMLDWGHLSSQPVTSLELNSVIQA